MSVCSNVEHYKEPICFVEEDPDKLIQVMVTYMVEIATHCKSLALDKWGAVLENLEEKLDYWRQEEKKAENSLAPIMNLRKCLGDLTFIVSKYLCWDLILHAMTLISLRKVLQSNSVSTYLKE